MTEGLTYNGEVDPGVGGGEVLVVDPAAVDALVSPSGLVEDQRRRGGGHAEVGPLPKDVRVGPLLGPGVGPFPGVVAAGERQGRLVAVGENRGVKWQCGREEGRLTAAGKEKWNVEVVKYE